MDSNEKSKANLLIFIGVILFLAFSLILVGSLIYKVGWLKTVDVKELNIADLDDSSKELLDIIINKNQNTLDFNSILILKDGDQNEGLYRDIKSKVKEREKESQVKVLIVDIHDIYSNIDKEKSNQEDLIKEYLDKIKFKDGDLLLYNNKGEPTKINGNIMRSNKIKPVGDITSDELYYVKTNIVKNNVNIDDIINELSK